MTRGSAGPASLSPRDPSLWRRESANRVDDAIGSAEERAERIEQKITALPTGTSEPPIVIEVSSCGQFSFSPRPEP